MLHRLNVINEAAKSQKQALLGKWQFHSEAAATLAAVRLEVMLMNRKSQE